MSPPLLWKWGTMWWNMVPSRLEEHGSAWKEKQGTQLQERIWGNFLLLNPVILPFVRESQAVRAYPYNRVLHGSLCPGFCLILHSTEQGCSKVEVQDSTKFSSLTDLTERQEGPLYYIYILQD